MKLIAGFFGLSAVTGVFLLASSPAVAVILASITTGIIMQKIAKFTIFDCFVLFGIGLFAMPIFGAIAGGVMLGAGICAAVS